MATKDMATAQRIGEKIREFRKAKGWSQAELAKKIGRLQSQVSEWETGFAEPQVATLLAIATALKVDVGQLLAR
jgi:transcriptional regulator with XRE-family HTH domain